jgi:hypothetical protein
MCDKFVFWRVQSAIMDVSTAQALKAQLADLMAQLTVLSNKVAAKSFNDMSLAEKIEYVNAQNGKSIEITDFSFINAEFCQKIRKNTVFNGNTFTQAIIDEILKQDNAKKGSLAHNLISAIYPLQLDNFHSIYVHKNIDFLADVVAEFPTANGWQVATAVCKSHGVIESADICIRIIKNSQYTVGNLVHHLIEEGHDVCASMVADAFPSELLSIIERNPAVIHNGTFSIICAHCDISTMKRAYIYICKSSRFCFSDREKLMLDSLFSNPNIAVQVKET